VSLRASIVFTDLRISSEFNSYHRRDRWAAWSADSQRKTRANSRPPMTDRPKSGQTCRRPATRWVQTSPSTFEAPGFRGGTHPSKPRARHTIFDGVDGTGPVGFHLTSSSSTPQRLHFVANSPVQGLRPSPSGTACREPPGRSDLCARRARSRLPRSPGLARRLDTFDLVAYDRRGYQGSRAAHTSWTRLSH